MGHFVGTLSQRQAWVADTSSPGAAPAVIGPTTGELSMEPSDDTRAALRRHIGVAWDDGGHETLLVESIPFMVGERINAICLTEDGERRLLRIAGEGSGITWTARKRTRYAHRPAGLVWLLPPMVGLAGLSLTGGPGVWVIAATLLATLLTLTLWLVLSAREMALAEYERQIGAALRGAETTTPRQEAPSAPIAAPSAKANTQ